jgi:hypothetical protein
MAMSNLNEAKVGYLKGQTLAAGSAPELEYAWLAGLTGKASGLNLEEQWHTYLDLLAIPPGSLAERQYAWLLTTGIPGINSKLNLSENFYIFWTQIGGIIIGGTATLNAGSTGGARVGFQDGVYGALNPDETSDGYQITALFCNNNNGRVRFKVAGQYQRDRFTSMEIVGVGTLLSADAIFDYDGSETEWRWNGTGFNLLDSTVYAVEFV